ncbi:hypothetical protein [uncultured Oscillibacter sp.]|uniref:hypothetical protein n=1 Tax=uncultured Oscillibacter sp. TaxID=876091 RepID=UPI0025ED00B1|nr:hypothetical protein [uncultured Oscillibacter sp.]
MKTMNSSVTRRFYACRLAVRTAAFAGLLFYALALPERFAADLAAGPLHPSPMTALWLLLMASMVFRLFPSRLESLGCQKVFGSRFRSTGRVVSPQAVREADLGAGRVLAVWAAANALILLAYRQGLADQRFLVCLAGFYGVCDIFCVLFFCPFQAWIMHNRCCTTCRIYNWDYLMLCTPLLALHNAFSQSACILATVVFLRWEVTYLFRRERFFESSNQSLQCRHCQEHLCRWKPGGKDLSKQTKASG